MATRASFGTLAVLVSVTISVSEARDAAEDVRAERSGSVTVAEVEGLISRVGVQNAVRELSQNPQTWRHVLREISAGSTAWLEVAGRLERGSDGGPGEQLVLAVQDALPVSPDSVLRLIKKGCFSVVHVCSGYGPTQMEDRRPKAVAMGLIRARREKVGAVVEGSLSEVRQACLEQLAKLEHNIRTTTPWPPEYD